MKQKTTRRNALVFSQGLLGHLPPNDLCLAGHADKERWLPGNGLRSSSQQVRSNRAGAFLPDLPSPPYEFKQTHAGFLRSLTDTLRALLTGRFFSNFPPSAFESTRSSNCSTGRVVACIGNVRRARAFAARRVPV